MNFNAKKCYILAVSRKRQKHVRSHTLGNTSLLPVESFTCLGVIVSSDLRWHEHGVLAAVSAKATRVLNLLPRNINFCRPDVKASSP